MFSFNKTIFVRIQLLGTDDSDPGLRLADGWADIRNSD